MDAQLRPGIGGPAEAGEEGIVQDLRQAPLAAQREPVAPSDIILSSDEPEQGLAMKTPWILCTAAVAVGHFLTSGVLAAPMGSGGTAVSAPSGLVRVQAPEDIGDRMSRLREHRSILQDALRPSRQAAPAELPEPQSRALRPPEPMVLTAPQDRPLTQEPVDEGQGQVTCEAAADIVADFGFSEIGRPDCSGDLYRFSAMRDGTAYAIGVSAATGEIAEVSRQ